MGKELNIKENDDGSIVIHKVNEEDYEYHSLIELNKDEVEYLKEWFDTNK